MSKCRLIVHADDFGLTEKVNEGIIRGCRNGILTSASIMACGQAFEHAVAQYHAFNSLDLGIHLTLVEERAILPVEKVPSLVDTNGHFVSDAFSFTKKYLLGRIPLNEVRAEFEAQIIKVKDYGLPISHIDSHQHLHVLPGINRITRDLAYKYHIPAIRVPAEKPRPYMLNEYKSLKRLLQLLIINALCVNKNSSELFKTDGFIGFFHGGRITGEVLTQLLNALPRNGLWELMCHPGEKDCESKYIEWGYHHADELEAVCKYELKCRLQEQGIELTSYGALFGKS